jgi:hypothetical protein
MQRHKELGGPTKQENYKRRRIKKSVKSALLGRTTRSTDYRTQCGREAEPPIGIGVAHDNTHCSSYSEQKRYRDLRLLEILDRFSSSMARSTRLDERNFRVENKSDLKRITKVRGEKPNMGPQN